ncbi:hypothetical protein BsWGS_23817 [Bradybaena similaris]
MFPAWILLVLLMCGHRRSQAAGDCPYKECGCIGTSIYCPSHGLTSMPIRYNINATGYLTLNLGSNHITEIPAGSLPPGLRELSLIVNPITTIDDNAFDDVSSTLESLYFINAQFSRISNAFLHLDSLYYLMIVNTQILDWNIGAMTHLGETLRILKLEQVGLSTWPVWLTDMENLSELNLADNTISSIPDNAFDKASNSLLILSLSNNSLTAAPKSLVNLINLTTLDLQNNKISNITWLPQSKKLSSLSLNNNNISDADRLSSVLRTYTDSLSSLALSFNQLKVIPDLSSLVNLAFLDLSNNQIHDPNSGSAPNSTNEIDFSFNLLPSIPKIYRDMPSVFMMFLSHNIIQEVCGIDIPLWVTHLDLQYNLIAELNDTSFPVNSSLEELFLDNNPLNTISELAFSNLAILDRLSLQNTKLTRLPLSLVYLTSITYINLNNNTGLVCTCAEKVVEKVSLYIDLNGNCGDVNIYDFLANLSPSCP